MQALQVAREYLAHVHPWLPAIVLIFVLWAPQAAIRRWLPDVWEVPANWPWRKTFPELEAPALALRKAWQALPSVAVGAFLTAASAGFDTTDAVLGAVVALGAPALHELWKAIRKRFPPPSAGVGAVALCLALSAVSAPACGVFGQGDGAESAAEVRAGALAYNGAAVALEVVAALEADRMAAMASPTAADIEAAEARVERLRRARDALEVARAWLSGDAARDDARRALVDGVRLLLLAARELEADGVRLPETVRQGLAAAAVWAGVA